MRIRKDIVESVETHLGFARDHLFKQDKEIEEDKPSL